MEVSIRAKSLESSAVIGRVSAETEIVFYQITLVE